MTTDSRANVAVFLPNWIGDAVMATPALRALRWRFATGKLVGVMKPYVAGVLQGGDWFDAVVLANGPQWSQSIPNVTRKLRQFQIDIAVLFPNSFRSALTAWLGGCKKRIGYARYGRSPLLTDALPPIRDAAGRLAPSPIIDAYNLLARHAGCQNPAHRMELFTTGADEAAADAVWARCGFQPQREVICLNPGAAFGSAKHWPVEHFAALARLLAHKRGAAVLVLCGPAEQEQAARIALLARHPGVHSLASGAVPLSIGLTKACIRRSTLLITTDSGPRHFAAAFDKPVVTLFGPTHIGWTETYFARAVHLQKKVDCGPCQQRVCPLDHRCMEELLPVEVLAAAERLLEGCVPLAG